MVRLEGELTATVEQACVVTLEPVAAEVADPKIEKAPARFEIDISRCVFCGMCVEACPVDAIRMDTYTTTNSSYGRESMILTLKELLDHPNTDMYPPPGPVDPGLQK